MQIDGIGSTMTVNSSISNRATQQITPTDNTQKVEQRPMPGSRPRQTKQNSDQKYVEEKHFSEQDVIGIIEKANKDFVAYDRKFEFSIHEATKQIMVKIIDVTTDEVIRELPPEKVLDMVAAIWEAVGIIVDRKV